ncbi:MAG: intradiol ring-cleavage dioxygenase [Chloroflexota bacterium]|nr:intradiol ring-cleavage dioxygenase [Chloroflexota bacterium]
MTIQQPQDDDAPVGRVLTRREVLTLLGAGTGAALLAACVPGALTGSSSSPSASASASTSAAASATGLAAAIPSCIVRPELTEGPYYVDEGLNRSDIRSDPASGDGREGAALALAFAVSCINGSSCTPFEGAIVDVWHCDALGIYSDVQDPSGSTVGQKFLRGYQLTDAAGMAAFTTIYPGWYRGRAVHIHFKVRTEPASGSGLEFTSQLFLDDSLTDSVHQRAPYASKGQRDTRNADDGIFQGGGDQLLLNPRQDGDGYAATFEIGVQVA